MIRSISVAMLPFLIASCSWMETDYRSAAKRERCENWQCIGDYENPKNNTRIEQEESDNDDRNSGAGITSEVPPQAISPLHQP